MNLETQSSQNITEITPRIFSDGKTRIQLSSFNTKQGKQIRLTNDERKALLRQFDNRKKRKSSWITIASGVCIAAFGAIFSVFISMMSNTSSVGILALCLAIPGIFVIIYGIHGVVTCPNIEKSVLNAYEFTVDAIYCITSIHYGKDMAYRGAVPVKRLISISARESAQFMPRSDDMSVPTLVLSFGGNNVGLLNPESFNAIRLGISVGDKVRCAVLENGKYCYISVF